MKRATRIIIITVFVLAMTIGLIAATLLFFALTGALYG
jgi:hypothetical protein